MFASTGVESLQCYNCRGITNYDPNECFWPTPETTILQECQEHEVCEVIVSFIFITSLITFIGAAVL